ncbi:unnamed protein product [Ectocarpus sp. 12 AP-2014]
MEGAMALAEQGKRLRKDGKLTEAEHVLKRSLGILEAKRGREGCAGMIMPLSELGVCLCLVGRPEEIELIAKRCLTIQEADLGPRSEHVAETLYLIGICLSHPNRAEEGENVARRCVEVQEGNVGGNSTRLLPALNLLGSCLMRLGRLEEAEGILRRSLTIGETNQATLERKHQQAMAATVHALGVCLSQAGKLEEAEGTLRRGLAIHEMEPGPEKLAALITVDLWTDYGLQQTYPHALHALGTCLLRAGKLEGVEDMLRRGLAIHEVHWGHDGVEVSDILVDLASYLRQTGELQEAEELLRRCLSIREAKLGLDDIMVGIVLLELGKCLLEATRAAEGADALRRCLNMHEAHLGLEHIVIPSVLYPLAECLVRTGKTDEAERMLRRCLGNQEANMGRDHQAVGCTLHVLGVFLRQKGKSEEAQELFRRCIEIFEAKTGPEHLCMITSTRLELGLCLRHEGELKEWGRSDVSVGSSGTLRMLDDEEWEYETLCDMFTARWIKPRPANGVSIVRIFSIQVPHEVRDMHEQYKRMVVVNLSQRFHGTSCNEGCNFMVDPQGATSPCGLSSCSVCSICMLGFKLGRNVARTALATCTPLRYGTGIYFSSVSGKANDYADLSAKTDKDGTELRCMFVANVAGGKAFNTKNPYLPQSECPPPGYQSVVGEVGQGLNFDEVVVYKEEAALPTHLIVYALRH